MTLDPGQSKKIKLLWHVFRETKETSSRRSGHEWGVLGFKPSEYACDRQTSDSRIDGLAFSIPLPMAGKSDRRSCDDHLINHHRISFLLLLLGRRWPPCCFVDVVAAFRQNEAPTNHTNCTTVASHRTGKRKLAEFNVS